MKTMNFTAAPATPHHFNARIIQFSSRPRLTVGDVVELCRDCLPGNRGKLAVIEKIDKEDGLIYVRSLMWPFDLRDKNTGEVTHSSEMRVWVPPENLYRHSATNIAVTQGCGRA